MIGTVKIFAGIALTRGAELGAAVRASIEKNLDITVPVAHHHHRLAADLGKIVIARVFYLALIWVDFAWVH